MSTMPPPGQGAGAPAGASPAPAPSAAPASPEQMMLAQMYQVCKRLAQSNPAMSAGMTKAAEGIQEAQTAMLTQGQGPSPTQNPPQ